MVDAASDGENRKKSPPILRFTARSPAAVICQRLDEAKSIPRNEPVTLVFLSVQFDMAILSSILQLFRARNAPKSWKALTIKPRSTTQWPLIAEQLLQPLNDSILNAKDRTNVSVIERISFYSKLPPIVFQWIGAQSIARSIWITASDMDREDIASLFPSADDDATSSNSGQRKRRSTKEHQYLSDNNVIWEVLRIVNGSFCDSGGFRWFVRGVKRKGLKKLELERCNLQDDELAYLFHHNSEVKEQAGFNLLHIGVGINFVQERTIRAISDLLVQPDCKIQILDISRPESWDDRHYLTYLFRALATSTSMETLDISSNFLRDLHILGGLFAALRQNSKLQILNLGGNNLQEEAIEELGKALPTFPGLKRLRLTNNEVSERSIQHLINGMKQNDTLEGLILDQPSPKIEYWCMLNRYGRKFCRPNALPVSLWPHVLARPNGKDDQINVLYHFLRHGPVLSSR